MAPVKPLDVSVLYRHTNPDSFEFETTNDLHEVVTESIGQPRAVEAVNFGMGINRNGYNIFALGPTGLGKRSLIKRFFDEKATGMPVPDDWVYVHNFKERHKPQAISLPAGRGKIFQQDMDNLVNELRTALTAAFESDEYRSRKGVIEQEFSERQEKALEALQEKARQKNFSMLRTPGGLVFAPTRNGEVLTPEQFQGLSEEERKEIESQMEELQNELQKLLQQVPEFQREIRERMHELNRGFIDFAVGGLIRDLQQKYVDFPEISAYLKDVKEDVIENADELLPKEEEATSTNPLLTLISRAQSSTPGLLNRYKVNLLVDHSEMKGAPVIYEDNPTYQNLIGEVEHIAQMGALVTDFTLIKPGSLHKANGGFLILDARKLLSQPYAWEGLKRALQSGNITIESLGQMLSVITTVTLEPEPIPLNIKIALYGDRLLYYLLLQYDQDFPELFKVQADFEEQMPRDDGNQSLYARLLAGMVRRNQLRPFDRNAISRVIEYSSRLVEDSQRLTLHLETISDLLQEADYYAGTRNQQVVGREDVQKAIEARIYRADRLREREQETILRNIWLIDTQGEKVGQVNGLSVLTLGNYSFGRPSRITARVWIGKGDLVDIDRQVDLSGPIHSKGVLILAGFLGARYAREKPLSLSASLAFEQSYSGIEGDSASSAELYALLSAIAEAPIKQNFAVTGAINQYGQVQAIGGVNEKIEGFFDICNARGLTGDQGVLIPSANIVHLMLRQDVIDAVRQGKFFIYPVDHIDQGIEILTGIPAGEPNEQRIYPENTINGKVQRRLEELAEKREEFHKGEETETEEEQEEKEPAKVSTPEEGEQ